ncbi:MAG: hypothetical protein O7G87_02745, partial [bacterium]|nr:hypothetical protein [bacterium]
ALRIRGNPFKFLDPRYYISNPLEPFVHLVEDSAFFAREGFKGLVQFATSRRSLTHRFLDLLDLSMFFSAEPYLDVIKKYIRFENICRSGRALRIDATNWDTGKLEVFSNQDMTDDFGPLCIQASGALPGFFPHVEMDTQRYADAAVLGYAWPTPAVEAGADTLHLIYVDPDPDIQQTSGKRFGTLDTMYRVFLTIWARRVTTRIGDEENLSLFKDYLEKLFRSRKLSDSEAQYLLNRVLAFEGGTHQEEGLDRRITLHNYYPRRELGGYVGFLDFKRDRIRKLIELGYDDTIEHNCSTMGCVLPEGLE